MKSPEKLGIAESTRRFSGIVFSSSETRRVLGEKAVVANAFQRDGPENFKKQIPKKLSAMLSINSLTERNPPGGTA